MPEFLHLTMLSFIVHKIIQFKDLWKHGLKLTHSNCVLGCTLEIDSPAPLYPSVVMKVSKFEKLFQNLCDIWFFNQSIKFWDQGVKVYNKSNIQANLFLWYTLLRIKASKKFWTMNGTFVNHTSEVMHHLSNSLFSYVLFLKSDLRTSKRHKKIWGFSWSMNNEIVVCLFQQKHFYSSFRKCSYIGVFLMCWNWLRLNRAIWQDSQTTKWESSNENGCFYLLYFLSWQNFIAERFLEKNNR